MIVASLSNEKQVRADCPPTFLFHTTEDQAVAPQNSLVLMECLLCVGVPAELHIFQKGRHGVGLARDLPGTSAWSDRCLDWLRVNGWL